MIILKIAIVVVGYNRAASVKRLFESLDAANYDNDVVELIVSIDKSDCNDVENVAEKFKWKYGKKTIIKHKENLGLRKHILKCGELTKKYDAIIVLEDDIYVSPAFYIYSKQLINKYRFDDNIAGISLYSHKWNVNVNRPFEPADDMYDVYFLQYAQSWGQVWTKKWWDEFMVWYKENSEKDLKEYRIPDIVANWPNTSWLKYHITYLMCSNKYFVYPRVSLSTNFTEVGEHVKKFRADYQVSLQLSNDKNFILCNFKDGIKYDVYFERVPEQLLKDEYYINNTCVDLYGSKNNYENKKYLLTTRIKDFKVVKKYGLVLRPHDNNIKFNIKGNQIFLYDINKMYKNPFRKSKQNINIISYDVRATDRKKLILLIFDYLKEKLKLK